MGLGERVADVTWTASAVGALAYLSLVASALGFLLYFDLLERLGAVEINLVSYVGPIWAALVGWLLLTETPSLATWIGFVIIFAGSSERRFRGGERDNRRISVRSLRLRLTEVNPAPVEENHHCSGPWTRLTSR